MTGVADHFSAQCHSGGGDGDKTRREAEIRQAAQALGLLAAKQVTARRMEAFCERFDQEMRILGDKLKAIPQSRPSASLGQPQLGMESSAKKMQSPAATRSLEMTLTQQDLNRLPTNPLMIGSSMSEKHKTGLSGSNPIGPSMDGSAQAPSISPSPASVARVDTAAPGIAPPAPFFANATNAAGKKATRAVSFSVGPMQGQQQSFGITPATRSHSFGAQQRPATILENGEVRSQSPAPTYGFPRSTSRGPSFPRSPSRDSRGEYFPRMATFSMATAEARPAAFDPSRVSFDASRAVSPFRPVSPGPQARGVATPGMPGMPGAARSFRVPSFESTPQPTAAVPATNVSNKLQAARAEAARAAQVAAGAAADAAQAAERATKAAAAVAAARQRHGPRPNTAPAQQRSPSFMVNGAAGQANPPPASQPLPAQGPSVGTVLQAPKTPSLNAPNSTAPSMPLSMNQGPSFYSAPPSSTGFPRAVSTIATQQQLNNPPSVPPGSQQAMQPTMAMPKPLVPTASHHVSSGSAMPMHTRGINLGNGSPLRPNPSAYPTVPEHGGGGTFYCGTEVMEAALIGSENRFAAMQEACGAPMPGAKAGREEASMQDYISYGKSLVSDMFRGLTG